jgi:beta-lactamase class A
MRMRRTFPAAAMVLALLAATGCGSQDAGGPSAGGPTAPGQKVSGQIVSGRSGEAAALGEKAKELEKQYDARLGIYALDTGTGRTAAYRAEERFAYASTFKALAAGVILKRTKVSGLKKRITYASGDIVSHSPTTEKHVADGMTLGEVIEAAITVSDNTAMNLMFREVGGPAVMERELRAVGDRTVEVDRVETELNTAVPGDKRDTSTPRAMATSLRAYATGTALQKPERDQLVAWLKANTTGDKLIRAGVPDGWVVGDKTGGGDYGTRNDIAVVWPPDAAPIVLAVMSTKDEQDAAYDDKLIADAAALIIPELAN